LTLNGEAYIANNQAVSGGAIYFENNSTTEEKNLQIIGQHGDIFFVSNRAQNRGGAIYIKGVDTNAWSLLTLSANASNVIFRGNSADNVSNDIYLEGFSKLVLNSTNKSVAIMSGIRAPQANEITVENNGGKNIIGGNVNVAGKAVVNEGVLVFSANSGVSTVYGQAGFVNEIIVAPGAALNIDPTAASKIEGSGYSKRYADHSNPKMARIKAQDITMNGNLIMNVDVDESAYGQLVMAYSGNIDNVETATFTAIVKGYGVAAGKFIVWEPLNGQSGAFNFDNTFKDVKISGGNDFEILAFVSTSAAQVRTNGYFGRFAVVNYFDLDNALKKLNYTQSRAASNLYAAHRDGSDRQDGDVKDLLIAATANTAPSADPTGYKGRQIFDMLSGSFISNVLKQSALNNTEGLYRRMDRDIKKNGGENDLEESISDRGWSYLTFSGVQYEEYKDNVREFKNSQIGFQGGADMIVRDDLLAGAYFGYARGSYKQGLDKASSNGLEAGLYGGYFWNVLNFKASLGLGWQNIGIKRNILIESVSMEGYGFSGYEAHIKSQFNVYTVKYAAEAEFLSEVGNESDIRPFIAFQGGTVYNGEIKEKSASSSNLIINSGKYDRLAALYGVRFVENGFGNTIRWRASIYGGYVLNGAKAQYEAKFLDNDMTIYSLQENLAFLGLGGGFEYDINEKIFAFSSLDINRNNGFMGYSVQIGASYRLGRKQGGVIRNRTPPAIKAQSIRLLSAIVNNWMSEEAEKGNTKATMKDALEALKIEEGMSIYVVEADGKLSCSKEREVAVAFVKSLQGKGSQVTELDIHVITINAEYINEAQNRL
jgi:predicted outer membrane repeat protein